MADRPGGWLSAPRGMADRPRGQPPSLAFPNQLALGQRRWQGLGQALPMLGWAWATGRGHWGHCHAESPSTPAGAAAFETEQTEKPWLGQEGGARAARAGPWTQFCVSSRAASRQADQEAACWGPSATSQNRHLCHLTNASRPCPCARDVPDTEAGTCSARDQCGFKVILWAEEEGGQAGLSTRSGDLLSLCAGLSLPSTVSS